MNGYNHAEAFCLMRYQDEVTGEVEVIWNSRDGVTPFVIHSRAGNEARHVDWKLDRCVPDHKPNRGDRIFVDLTEARARECAERQVERHWDRVDFPMSARFASRDEAVRELMKGYLTPPGQPDLIEVTS